MEINGIITEIACAIGFLHRKLKINIAPRNLSSKEWLTWRTFVKINLMHAASVLVLVWHAYRHLFVPKEALLIMVKRNWMNHLSCF